MKSASLEEAYQRLWDATENGFDTDEFFELREEARRFLYIAGENVLMQHAGELLLEVHEEWEKVARRLGVTEDVLFEAFKTVKRHRSS